MVLDKQSRRAKITPAQARSHLFDTPEPGSKSAEALNLLASWTATLEQAEAAHATDDA